MLALVMPSFLLAQQYQFRNFSVGDGLAQSQVFCLLEDSRGYIWMGTRGGGVSRFDGERFETFTVEDGLRSNYIWSLAADTNGVVWIGTEAGLCRFVDGAIDSLSIVGNTLPITSLSFDENLILGTSEGMFLLALDLNRLVPFKFPGESPDLIMAQAKLDLRPYRGQEYWFAGDQGILRKVSSYEHKRFRAELSSPLVRALAVDSNQGVWIGTYGGGVNYYDGDSIRDMNELLQLTDARVHDIHITADGEVWFATQQRGICRYQPRDSLVEFITSQHGLANNHVRCIIEDRWGNTWIGTSGGGVSKYTGQQFRYFTERSGLKGSYIYSIAEDDQDRLLVATSGPGTNLNDRSRFVPAEFSEGLPQANVKTIFKDRDCNLWLGTDGAGIARVDSDTVTVINTLNGLGGNYVRDIVSDLDDRVWIALAGGGIDRLEQVDSTYSIVNFGRAQGLTSRRVNQLHLDQRGRMWYAASSGGIGYLENDTVRATWNTANGLASNDVSSLCEDQNGNLWVGTGGGGLHRLSIYSDSVSIANFTTRNGLSSNICYFVFCDIDNNLWMGSEKGVDRLRLDASGEVIEYDHFGLEEGFRGVETTLNSVYQDVNGNLWFGTINGLIEYTGEVEKSTPALPTLFFEQTLVNTEPFDLAGDAVDLSHDSNMLAFSFRAISQRKPRDLRYQWRLIGLEEEWSVPSTNNSVTYSNLKPGTYRLEVRASTGAEVWTQPLSASFSIRLPYWEEWWFLVSTIGGMVILISGLVFWRIRAFQRYAREQRHQLQLQNEVLELEQKALRLQMNPHFIFNALNSIQAMISSNDAKTARYYLAKFSKLMRQTLDNSRQSQIPLEREVAALENYLSIERFCHNERFDYELEVEDEIDPEYVMLPPILVQPFIENAIIHGVSQLEHGGLIQVHFKQRDGYLICEIEDNGIGREAAEKVKSQEDQKHKSTALLITQERLDNLNQRQEGQSIEIIDLKNEQGKGTGTKVVVRVWLGQA